MRAVVEGGLWAAGLCLTGLAIAISADLQQAAPLTTAIEQPVLPRDADSAIALTTPTPVASQRDSQPTDMAPPPRLAVAPPPAAVLPDFLTAVAQAPQISQIDTPWTAPDFVTAPFVPSGVDVPRQDVGVATAPEPPLRDTPAIVALGDPQGNVAERVPQTDSAEPEASPAVLPDAPDVPAEEPALVATANRPAPAVPQVVDRSAAATTLSTVVSQRQRAVPLPQFEDTVTINRPGTVVPPAQSPDTTATDPGAAAETALLRYAADFENLGGLPAISLVLIDTSQMPDGAGAVTALGFSPTVIVNALADDASQIMARYRAAGIEVAVDMALPLGSRQIDSVTAFEDAFAIVPEAAMLFSDGTGVLQNDLAVSAQVMEVLARDGRGFITVPRGLGNALRAAEQSDVAAATILYDLDGKGEDSAAIIRALDRAVLRARQAGDVILMARLQPETLEVLQAWANTVDQGQIALAPVSAILRKQIDSPS